MISSFVTQCNPWPNTPQCKWHILYYSNIWKQHLEQSKDFSKHFKSEYHQHSPRGQGFSTVLCKWGYSGPPHGTVYGGYPLGTSVLTAKSGHQCVNSRSASEWRPHHTINRPSFTAAFYTPGRNYNFHFRLLRFWQWPSFRAWIFLCKTVLPPLQSVHAKLC